VERVGCGVDFCDDLLEHTSPAARSGLRQRATLSVEGPASDREAPKVSKMLSEQGSPPDAIDRIMGGSVLRVFKPAAG